MTMWKKRVSIGFAVWEIRIPCDGGDDDAVNGDFRSMSKTKY
jgi:hypothetical protein